MASSKETRGRFSLFQNALGSLLIGIFVGVFVLADPSSRPVFASENCTDNPQDEHHVALIKATPTHHPQHRSIRAGATGQGMWVGNSNVGCERVSSIYIFRNTDNWVQFGWYEAPESIPGAPHGDCGKTNGIPERLSEYNLLGGSQCMEFNYVIGTAPTWHRFKISNPELDEIYALYYDEGLVWATPNMGFTSGYNLAGTERTGGDSAFGHFQNLWYENYNGWHFWDEVCYANCNTPFGLEDNDNFWKAVKVDGTNYHLKVSSEIGIADES